MACGSPGYTESSSYAVSRSLLSGVFPTASKPICSSSTSLGLITSSLDLHQEYYSSSPHMGSSYRSKSTHMADIKGKGILYEDDDEPIKSLTRKNKVWRNFSRKCWFNGAWRNDLGNGKCLLNFTTEDELNSVLRQGPFHFNFCIFVLVRWEPIVHDDYPWIIPFWTRLIGVPLHLWTENNLREIGSRLGHVHQDTIELI
ncbi:hypothetical protein YC2023_059631 [Brassica napus]